MSNRPSVVKTDLRGRQAAACVVKEKLWKDRQVLRVFFMKPGSEVLEGWKCEGKEMTTEMIMEWAGAWQQAPSAPQFEVAERVVRADIRVKFSGTGSYKNLLHVQYVCHHMKHCLHTCSHRTMLISGGYGGSLHCSR